MWGATDSKDSAVDGSRVLPRGIQVAGLIAGLMFLVACGRRELVEPTPSVPASDSGATWDYVALGDARTAGADWPELYAAHVEADLGVKVTVHNWASVNQTSEALLASLRDNESLRQLVGKAEIVTLWTGGYVVKETLTKHHLPCEPTVDAYASDLDAIIFEILALRGRRATIVRLLDFYQFRVTVLKDLEILEEKKACLTTYNGRIHQIASKYLIPVAPVHREFNGHDGYEDADDKGYFRNDAQLSWAGDLVIANLLRELGYRAASPTVLASAAD